MRYFVKTSFDGTNYSGWQKQKNAPSVQENIENAFSVLTKQNSPITGCGRTDSGVHARNYYFHLELPEKMATSDVNKLLYSANQILPSDIVLHNMIEAPNMHARFDAVKRSYSYYIHTVKSPFKGRYSSFLPRAVKVDDKKLRQVADLLMKCRDFKAFCKSHSDVKTTWCTIEKSSWEISKESLVFTISANRFLRGMVRLIVGASLNVSMGKLTLDDLYGALNEQKPLPINWSVPACGLFFTGADY